MRLFSLSSPRIFIIALFLGFSTVSFSQNSVSIGTTSTNPKAVLWLSGTNQGIIIPIVANKTNVSAGPTEKGMVVFDDSDKKVYFFDGTAWNQVGGSGSAGSQGIAINGNTVQLNSTSGATFGLSNTAPTGKGQLLVWDGTKWEATLAPTTNGQTLSWDNTNGRWTLANASLTLAGDVSGPSNNTSIASTSGNNIVAALNNAATTSKILPAQITAGTPNQVLTTSAGNVAVWANLPTASGTVTSIATGTGLIGGPITTTGTIALANTAVAPATYGSTTQIPQIAVDAQGRITSASNVTPSLAGVASTGFLSAADWNTFNNKLTTETDPTVKAINGLVKSNGTTISAATAGTDYLAPNGNGSALTNLNASNLASGTVPTARIDVGTTANKIVQLDGTGKLPAIDGSQLINLPAGTETDPSVKAINGLVKSDGTTIGAVVSGTDIKTINGNSILGAGNIATLTTVTSAEITDGTIADVDINASANINGTKINPNFGAQPISTTSTLTTGSSGQFVINASGNITKINNVATSFPAAQGLANSVLTNDGSGNLTWTPNNNWGLTGNTGTNGATNFIGTTDAQPFVLKANNTEGIRIGTDGGVSISEDVLSNRKIVFYDITGNTNQIIGFGLNPGALRYQVDQTTTSHVFYAGTSPTTSNELFRIQGNGNVGVGNSSPTAKLDIAGNIKIADGTQGANKVLTSDANGLASWQAVAGTGTVTSVSAGTGLTGGPITSSGSLAVDVGTTANKIVQLDGTGKLPAIDGSQLLNLPAGTETDPTVTAINGLVKSNGTIISAATAGTDYQAPLVSGTNIKTINGNSVLGAGNITAVTTETDPTVTAINGLVKSNGTVISAATAGTDYLAPNGNGSALTNLNATNISSGTLAIANGGTGATTAPAARTALGLGTLSTLSTVTSSEITDGTIVDADINGTANINGAKINPAFGAQAVSTTSTLTTGTAGQFVVDASGNITKINNITTSFPSTQGAANSVLTNDGAGNLTWATGSGWSLSGNALAGGEKIGSTNGNPLPFITNNVERMRIDPSGNVGIGTTAPTQPLHVEGPEGQFLVTPNLSGPGATSLMAQLLNTTSKGPQVRFAGAVGGAAFNDIGQDATGNFVIEASDVPLLTLNQNGALGVGSTPSFGTPGFVLTSNGAGGAPIWQAVSGTGTVTSVGAGTGLVGGPITTSGSLAVDVGTTANKIVQLDGTGKLPAVDGSQLLNLPAGTETDPTVKAINGLVKSDGTTISAATAGTDYLAPNGNGSALTNLNASNLASGTVPTARIDVGTTANKIVQLDGTGKLPAIDGSQLLNLPAGTETDPTVTAINGIVKSNGTIISAATAGTDYQAPLVSGTNIKTINGNSILGAGNLTAVTTETDPTVTAINGLVKSNGTIISAATAGTDYLAPNGNGSALTNLNATNISSGTLAIANGGTGATTAPGARTALGLGTLATLNTVGSAEITDASIGVADLNPAAGILSNGSFPNSVGDVVGDFASGLTLQNNAATGANIANVLNTNGAYNLTTTGTLSTGAATVTGLTIGTSVWPATASGSLTNDGLGNLAWVPSGGSGTVTSITRGAGLVAGPAITTSGTLDVNVGTGANQIVQLDGTAKLPAIDGSQLINLPTGTETDPTVKAINGLVKSDGTTIGAVVSGTDVKTINGTSILGAGDITTLTTVTSADITDGTIVDADINGTANINGAKINPAFGAQAVSTTSTLTTGSAGQFVVDATGNITKINNITTSFPATQGVVNSVLTNDGAGNLTWAASSGWGITGNAGTVDGTNFIGTTDNIPFTIRVNNQQAMRISFTNATSAPNILAGYSGNTITTGVVGSAILSGGFSGQINQVTDNHSVIGGGALNVAGNNDADPANAAAATVSGGNLNKATSSFATVGGGYNNLANGNSAVVAGGRNATASGEAAGVLSGEVNVASGFRSAVVGGNANTASGANSFVGGGEFNGATGDYSAVSGGGNNLASGLMSSIPGGRGLFARSFGETAVGLFNTDYTPASTTSFNASDRLFVIGNGNDFSTRSNALTVLKNGNLGIGNVNPSEKLDITGNLKFSGALMPNNTAGTAGQVLTSGGPGVAPTWEAVSGTGTVTSVGAGTGLVGGPITTSGSLAVDVGTTANKIVQLDGTGKLPAIDGSQLLNLPAGTETDPTVTAINGIVKSNGTIISAATAGTDYLAPNGNGSALTNLNASNLASGTVPTARIDVGTTANKIVQLDGTGKLPAIDGSQLINLPAGTETDPTVKAINGLVKSNGTTISAATPGTDYVATETDPAVKAINGLVKSNGTTISAATAGTDYQAPLVSGTNIKTINGTSILGAGDITTLTTVTSADITDGTIVDADINGTANINGAKINPAFGAQAVSTTSTLTTGTAGQFVVDASGNITKINNITTSFPTNQGAANSVLTNDGAGNLTWATGSGWSLSGNALAGGEKIGSTNATPLTLITSGADRMAIDVNGNVGIGTTTPTERLHLAGRLRIVSGQIGLIHTDGTTEMGTFVDGTAGWFGTNSNHPLWLYTNNSSSPPGIAITVANNVGINQSLPTARLDVNGDLRLEPLAAPAILTDKLYNVGGDLFWNGTNLSAGSVFTASNGITKTGNDFTLGGTLTGQTVINRAGNDFNIIGSGNFGVRTGPPGTDRLFVDGATGNVGIGTNGPSQALSVSGGIIVDHAGSNNGIFVQSQVLQFGTGSGEGIGSSRQPGQETLDFYTGAAKQMTIKKTGNIGIGTDTPLTLLQIGGTLGFFNASGDDIISHGIYFDGSNFINRSTAENSAILLGDGKAGMYTFPAGAAAGAASSPSMRFNVRPTGVGIQVDNPIETFQVNGATYLNPITAPSTTTDRLYNVSGDLFWNGTNISSGGSGWSLTGNAGTVDGTNFIGTTDDVPVNFLMNGQKAGRIERSIGGLAANTFYGYQSGNVNTSGWFNTGIGYQALSNNTTGTNNTAQGWSSLLSNTTGGDNTAFGSGALVGNTTGSFNTVIGSSSFSDNTIGNNNTATGWGTLSNNTTGNGNTASGYSSMFNSTTGGNNTAYGNNSLLTNTTGSNNTVIGSSADVASNNLSNATALGAGAIVTASNTIQLGNSGVTTVNVGTGTTAKLVAGQLQITGGTLSAGRVLTSDASGNATWQNAAGGWGLTGTAGTNSATNFIGTTDNVALRFKTNNVNSGLIDPLTSNAFFGYRAGEVTTGGQNVALGTNALVVNNSGAGNVALGTGALQTNTSGTGNIAIGNFADVSSPGLVNSIAIGRNAIVGASNSMVLGGTGVDAVNVGIGTTQPVSDLQITTATHLFDFPSGSGFAHNIRESGGNLLHTTAGGASVLGLEPSKAGLYVNSTAAANASFGTSLANRMVLTETGLSVNKDAADNSAVLHVVSETTAGGGTPRGFMMPAVTTADRDAITAPLTGLMIFNQTTNAFNFYNGTNWAPISGASLNAGLGLTLNGSNLDLGATNMPTATTFQGAADNMLEIQSSGSALGTKAGIHFKMFQSAINTQYEIFTRKMDAIANSGNSDLVMTKVFSTAGGYLDAFTIENGTNNVIINNDKTTASNYGNFIVRNGNTGIGTTAPASKLHVSGTTSVASRAAGTLLDVNTTLTDTNSYIRFAQDGTNLQNPVFVGVDFDNGISEFWNQDGMDMRFGTNNAERLRITTAGNVGIGVSNPVTGLDVFSNNGIRLNSYLGAGSTASGSAYLGANLYQGYANNFWYWANTNGSVGGAAIGLNSSAASNSIQFFRAAGPSTANALAGSLQESMRIDASGNVGIGTTNPNGFSGKILHLSGTGNTGYILEKTDATPRKWGIVLGGSGEYVIQDMTAGGVNPFLMQPGVIPGQLYMKAGGFTGINNSNPSYPLDVSGGVSYTTPFGPFDWLANSGGSGVTGGGNVFAVSIRANNHILANGFLATSDSRIKENLFASNSSKDLEKIMALKVTDYQYKDRAAQGNRIQKGFIAQEVKEVIPEAVNILATGEFIPSIYSSAKAANKTDGVVKIELSKEHNLKVGDQVRLFNDRTQFNETVTEISSPTTFTVKNAAISTENLFVYGKEVKDLHTVDYDRIYTIGIGAIQELNKKLDAQQKVIDSLQSQDAENKKKIALLEASLNKAATSEGELASLKSEIEKIKAALGLTVDAALPKKEEKK